MKFDNSVKVQSVKDRSHIDLSNNHVTTSDFNVIKPIYVTELVPSDKISIDVASWVRLQPLVAPTFGRCDMVTRAFFVPYRLVWKDFNDFYATRKSPTGSSTRLYNHVPCFANYQLLYALHAANESNKFGNLKLWEQVRYNPLDPDDPLNEPYDYYLLNGDSTGRFVKFTSIGKRVVDVLNSLGYSIPFNIDSSFCVISDTTCFLSALPLLAWLRMFYDWFLPSRYYDKYALAKSDEYVDYQANQSNLNDLVAMLAHFVYRYYNDDLFVACNEDPFVFQSSESASPTDITLSQNLESAGDVLDSSRQSGVKGHRLYSSVTQAQDTNDSAIFLRMSLAVAQQMQRHNLVSPRVSEYLKATFGVSGLEVRTDITEYLGMSSQPVEISAVYGTADENLADFGGQGDVSDRKVFKYSADEFGLIMVISQIVPRAGYGQGDKQHTHRIFVNDFYNPVYDALGFEPVPYSHLFKNFYSDQYYVQSKTNIRDNKIWGFLPRYTLGYKSETDCISGDLLFPTKKTGLDSFHLMRSFDLDRYLRNEDNILANDESFCYSGVYMSETNFDRIFTDNNLENDHFICVHSFNIDVSRPMLALNESWQVNPDGEETHGNIVNRGGSLD